MNLLAIVPLPYRILAVCGLFLATLLAGWVLGIKHEEVKFDKYKAAEARQSLAIQTATIAKTAQLQKQKDEATHAANEREKKLRADVARGGDQLAGLRRELADSRSKLSSASSDSLRKRVAALEDIFQQCSGRYQELAGHADRFASDAMTLRESWPK